MSTRVSATVKMTAACQDLVRHRLQLPPTATAQLESLKAMMATGRAELPALRQMVGRETVRSTLGALAPAAFQQACTMLTTAKVPGISQAAFAASVQSQLSDAVSAAETSIANATRALTADAFAQAGADLGYTVSVCAGNSTTGMELRRNHELILLRIHNGGAVESDQAGLKDATCGDRQRELEEGAARLGITFADRCQRNHGLAVGGDLITTAARQHDTSLARATVRDAEPASAPERGPRLFDPGAVTEPGKRARTTRRGGA
jgi:hypothetical protein